MAKSDLAHLVNSASGEAEFDSVEAVGIEPTYKMFLMRYRQA